MGYGAGEIERPVLCHSGTPVTAADVAAPIRNEWLA